MPPSGSDDLVSKSKLLRQRIQARNNPKPMPVSPPKATPDHQGNMVVVAEKPKRSPFEKLAYATIALLVFNLPYLLYPMYAEPVHHPFAGMGQALLMLICFVPLLLVSVVVWWIAAVESVVELVRRKMRQGGLSGDVG